MDVVGFSLQYEMTFTNVLEMLDLAGIPLRAAQRGESDPLVVAGGPVVFNCEPIADFLDFVFVGDAEELLPEFLDTLKALKRAGAPRAARIRELAKIQGIYAPALYDLVDDRRAPDPGRATGGRRTRSSGASSTTSTSSRFPTGSSCPTARSCTTASRSS